MPPAKLPLVPLHLMQPHVLSDCFALLIEKSPGTTRDGKPFYSCKFQNKQRTLSAMIWADHALYAAAEAWPLGGYFKLRGISTLNERYGPQIDLQQARETIEADRADGFREADLNICSRFDPEVMFVELRQLIETEIGDLPLRALILKVLDDHAPSLKKLPAHEKRFYTFPGGWLEHTLSVFRSCMMLTDYYLKRYDDRERPLNRDLVLAGAALHDVGRVVQWKLPAVPGQPVELTVPGGLFGHIALGRDVVRDAARTIANLNPELLQLLEHIIYAHLELPSWGSPKLPAIPEVLVLHHADDLDAKLEMYLRSLQNDISDGDFTNYDPTLGKLLLKKRSD